MRLTVALVTVLSPLACLAQYYKTLPMGVRSAIYRNIRVSDVNSTFNNNSTLNPISQSIEINSETFESMDNSEVKQFYEYMKAINPRWDGDITFGAVELSAAANLNVDAYGFAYGITNQVTAYAALPMYQAKVAMKYKKTKESNFSEIADNYSTETGNAQAQLIGGGFSGMPDVLNGSTIQNVLTQRYGYKPLGDWNGQGPGDLEFGLMYNFFENENGGLMLTAGGVAPTGMKDDPDILQDIAFGDGQWDVFAEFGGGLRLSSSTFLNSYARFTYQFESDKQLRVPEVEGSTVSDRKGDFSEKRGNKILLDMDADYIPSQWINFNAAYLYEKIGEASYRSPYGQANDWLARDTGSSAHNIRLKAEVSSIGAFQRNEFLLPGQIKFYYQSTLAGTNTPKANRYEVEFRMFF